MQEAKNPETPEELGKWTERKYDSLDGQVVVEYTKGPCVIEARSSGLVCKNIVVEDYKGLQDFAAALSKAWEMHERFRSILLQKLMGKRH